MEKNDIIKVVGGLVACAAVSATGYFLKKRAFKKMHEQMQAASKAGAAEIFKKRENGEAAAQ